MGVLQMANVQTVDTGRKKILYLKNVWCSTHDLYKRLAAFSLGVL